MASIFTCRSHIDRSKVSFLQDLITVHCSVVAGSKSSVAEIRSAGSGGVRLKNKVTRLSVKRLLNQSINIKGLQIGMDASLVSHSNAAENPRKSGDLHQPTVC